MSTSTWPSSDRSGEQLHDASLSVLTLRFQFWCLHRRRLRQEVLVWDLDFEISVFGFDNMELVMERLLWDSLFIILSADRQYKRPDHLIQNRGHTFNFKDTMFIFQNQCWNFGGRPRLPYEPGAVKSNERHYQSKVFVSVSIISGRMRIIAGMRSIGFQSFKHSNI